MLTVKLAKAEISMNILCIDQPSMGELLDGRRELGSQPA
jgi:hypothetical protein